MRKLPVFIFLIAIFYSCHNDTVVVNNDSILDTANHSVAANNDSDNNKLDTGNGSQNNVDIEYDCSVLNRYVPNDSNQKQIRKDLQELSHCGIDSFDFLYVLPNLFPSWLSENHVQGTKVKYKDFIKHMNEFKATDSYTQLHERVFTLDSLKSIPFDGKKVYAMKPVLGHLGFTEEEWEQFQGFARTYPIPKKGVFTWGDMVEAFDKYKPQ